jgi:putative sterol carrier protein
MPLFPSEEWVEAWLARANGSAEFAQAGSGWDGAVGLIIEADPQRGVAQTLFMRLEGRDGEWTGYSLGTDRARLGVTVFVLRAPYLRWKELIEQELQPVWALLQGKVRIEGHLPVIVRWMAAIIVLARLAGELETEFVDETGRRERVERGRGGV